MSQLTEPTALIIGASRGLGLGLAERFLERNWRVVATVRDRARRTRLHELAATAEGRFEIEQVDIDIVAQLQTLRAHLDGRKIDLLMVNAGTGGTAGASFEERFFQVMKTNVLGAMAAVHHLCDLVREDGVVAVMSSEVGSIADNDTGGWEPYRTSKAALNQSLRSFAAERPNAPWSLTAVAPGWTRTELGGPDAPLDVDTSTRGTVDMLETRFGRRGIAFMNYKGDTLPW
jgi:NAD(P)-dependent dehydrogenase (short-subunit alcohol dehydrogenase family)